MSDEHEAPTDGEETLGHEKMVRLRGLPYNVSQEQIREFFEDIKVDDIKMASSRDGRPSGECYCYLQSKEDAEKAVTTLNRKEMSQRYIEVFTVFSHEYEGLKLPGSVISAGGTVDRVIRLRGLPFSSTEEDIRNFLSGLTCDEVVIGQTGGRPSGEAYVRLGTKEEASQALELNRKTMGTRYIEVFRTDEADLARHREGRGGGGGDYVSRYPNRPPSLMSIETRNSGGSYGARGGSYDDYGGYGSGYGGPVYPSRRSGGPRSSPYDRSRNAYDSGAGYGGRGGSRGGDSEIFYNPGAVFMRGIPFDVHAAEIERFFAPLRCYNVKIGYNRDNRPSGDAVVEFDSLDFPQAFAKNKQYLGRRYVELFAGRDAPPPMKSLIWKELSGGSHPGPPPQARGPPAYNTQAAYGSQGYDDYYADPRAAYAAPAAAVPPAYAAPVPPGAGYQASYGYGSQEYPKHEALEYQDYKGAYPNGGGYGAPRGAPAPPPPPPPRDPYAAYDRNPYY